MEKKYPVNEIFHSLQGEGTHTGVSATFVRFSGCNLRCPFCDTDHSASKAMTAGEIIEAVKGLPPRMVVLTGGEPSLFVDDELIDRLHEAGKYVAMETNGTNPVPDRIDWITFSPKAGMEPGGEEIRLQRADEIKVVNVGQPLEPYFSLPQRRENTRMYLQPCFVSDEEERSRLLEATVGIVERDPRWTLSLQIHRYLGIP